ncbi:MAG: DNA alkylation repair protein [Actinomycetota bacterium]
MNPADAYAMSRVALAAIADPARSEQMARYMRDQFAFFGVGSPDRKQATADVVRSARRAEADELLDFATRCWEAAERELQYVATDALRAGANRFTPEHLDDLAELISTKSWWDTVDALAPHPVGSVVERHPDAGSEMDRWAGSDDIWIARSAILHQLRYKARTNEARLFRYSVQRAGDTEFFIRKAIGWALREYSKVAPDAVTAFVTEHEHELSGLTVREARKHLDRKRREMPHR